MHMKYLLPEMHGPESQRGNGMDPPERLPRAAVLGCSPEGLSVHIQRVQAHSAVVSEDLAPSRAGE